MHTLLLRCDTNFTRRHRVDKRMHCFVIYVYSPIIVEALWSVESLVGEVEARGCVLFTTACSIHVYHTTISNNAWEIPKQIYELEESMTRFMSPHFAPFWNVQVHRVTSKYLFG